MNFLKTKVALIIPSTSKNRSWDSPNDSLLYKTIVSFKQSTNDNFEYKLYIGYDYDDCFYNNKDNITFYENQGIAIEFIQLNVEKGHVTKMWNILAMRAYNDGFDYLYACGDDIIFNNTGWMDECINVLLQNNNIGLTGPITTDGNSFILTQCFVHRTHIDIFNFFYPEEIKNWYCDDWINLVYTGLLYKLPSDKYTCSNAGGKERYTRVHSSEICHQLVEHYRHVLHKYLQTIRNGTNHITILCDYNYLHYATALLLSMNDYNNENVVVHFLCLDQTTYQVVSNLQLNIKIICYKDDVVLSEPIVSNLKHNDTRYYFWSLASYFSNYIMKNVLTSTCKSVMYIDSDIFFHKDFHMLYDIYQEKDIGIFKHRFDAQAELNESGQFNVGIVYFKNTIKGRAILNWWTDAVIHKKYSNLGLHTCGDQKYLDAFPHMCAQKEIYIDENIGHGAPWNWASYSHIDANAYQIIYKGSLQPLVFTHFSKFKFDIQNNRYRFEFYEKFTDNNNIYKSPDLKKIHDEYFNKLKEADNLIQCKRI
jgi:hypothetical protein